MPTAIGYKSYMIRLWYGTEQADRSHLLDPAGGDGVVPLWLEQALSGEPLEEDPALQSGRVGEADQFYAEVEHIQTGQRWSFDTRDGLLGLLRGQGAEPRNIIPSLTRE